MTRSDVGFRSERGPVLVAIMLATGLVAIDATILATAVPTIVADLGGFAQFPWLFSIYLLAQAATVPVFGKLADMYGRKPVILFGIAVFLLGSVLCAAAWSMPALIAFRAVQGLGAAAIGPIAVTMVGDLYTLAERPRVQGYIGSVWGIASVIGPTFGGLFAQFAGWQWIFLVNVPLCLVAGGLIWRRFPERVETHPHRVDAAGAVLLTGGLSLVILGLLEGGQAWAWASWQTAAIFAAGVVLLVVFVLVERRAAEPILPFWVFSRRLLLTTTLIGLAIGAMLTGLSSYVPTYLEGTAGAPPLLAGFALAAMTIAWPIASFVAGRLYLRIGFRATARMGAAIIVIGAVVFLAVVSTPSVVLIAVASAVIGFGMGLTMTPSIVSAQSSVAWNERGVVTGINVFARNVGSALGLAVMGATANAILTATPGGETDPPTLIAATAAVFAVVGVIALGSMAVALALPRVQFDDPHASPDAPRDPHPAPAPDPA